jgi:two-component system, OmpR family, KDP operon response regulator KdpE
MIMGQNSHPRILIVDDETATRRLLKVTLSTHGYALSEASNASQAFNQLTSFDPNIILLDLNLPDKDGFETLREIRAAGITAPIIILSTRDQEVDKIEAFDAGADDYLIKPFSSGELMARLRALLRRLYPESDDKILEAGGLMLDTARHSVEMEGRKLHLTPTEFDVLKVLITNSNRVVTRRQLLQKVWNKTELTDKNGHLLRVIISNLRDKVEADPAQPLYILTEAGVGYRLQAPSKAAAQEPAA